MPIESLPYVDEHAVEIAAAPDEVWRSLTDVVDRSFSRPAAAAYARLVRTTDTHTGGPRPLSTGSAFPGFHVVSAAPARELTLRGGHRFSTYALRFRVSPTTPTRTRLSAETRAAFPGPTGTLYRHLVLTTRAHTLGLHRLLTAIRHEAEHG